LGRGRERKRRGGKEGSKGIGRRGKWKGVKGREREKQEERERGEGKARNSVQF